MMLKHKDISIFLNNNFNIILNGFLILNECILFNRIYKLISEKINLITGV